MSFNRFLFTTTLIFSVAVMFYGCSGKQTPKEGVLTFAIDYPDSKDNFFLYHVLPKEMKTSFKDNKMELQIRKASLENTIVVDCEQQKVFAYYHYDKIFACMLTDEESKLLTDKQPDYQIRFTKEKDTLLGFDIEKAIATDPAQPNRPITIWFTRDIKVKNPNWFNGFEKIPGVMLKYEVEQYGMRMQFVAKKFEPVTIPDSLVTLKRPGKLVNHKEFDGVISELFESFK